MSNAALSRRAALGVRLTFALGSVRLVCPSDWFVAGLMGSAWITFEVSLTMFGPPESNSESLNTSNGRWPIENVALRKRMGDGAVVVEAIESESLRSADGGRPAIWSSTPLVALLFDRRPFPVSLPARSERLPLMPERLLCSSGKTVIETLVLSFESFPPSRNLETHILYTMEPCACSDLYGCSWLFVG